MFFFFNSSKAKKDIKGQFDKEPYLPEAICSSAANISGGRAKPGLPFGAGPGP